MTISSIRRPSGRSQSLACLMNQPVENGWVRLKPLEPGWAPELEASGADEKVMRHMPALPGYGLTFKAHQNHVLAEAAAGRMVPLIAYRTGTDIWIGGATFTNIDRTHRSLRIDYLWLNDHYRRSAYHLALQSLLIERSIAWGAKRLEWRVDVRNQRASMAIRKLGAVHEGIARSGQRMANGDWADLDIYSMVGSELKAGLSGLQLRLEAFKAEHPLMSDEVS